MKHTLFLLLFCFSFPLLGQETAPLNEKDVVQLTTKHYGDKIVLRFAPVDEEAWVYGMINGYKIERKDVSELSNEYEVIVDTLKPWSSNRIEQFYVENPDKEQVAIPLQTMYNEWENTNYKKGMSLEQMYENSTYFKQRHQMTILAADMFPHAADAAGLRYEDVSIDQEALYSYRVSINYSEVQKSAYSVAKKWQIIDRPLIIEAKEMEEKISITWDRGLHEKIYTGYFIERSLDNINWDRLTEHPYVQGIGEGLAAGKYISYLDEVDNYQLFYYRLIGIDAFGDLSQPSEPVLAQGKDRTPPEVARPFAYKSESGDANLIVWEHENMDEIQQAIIWKEDDTSDATLVYQFNQDQTWKYQIEDAEINDGMSRYQLILVDTAGNFGQSEFVDVFRADTKPPSPPINLKADVDTTGRVILTWDQGPDLDVLAYYVFTAPRKNDNYIKLNQKKHLFRLYEDSINMTLLTDKRYYKVAAMDKSGNIGDYSEILEVNLPDKIPPAPSLFYDYRVDSAGVFLGLMKSSSADVIAHKLYRKKQKSTDWKLIETFSKNPPQVFRDNDLSSGGSYSYKWVAEDEGGLQSNYEHSMISVTAFDIRTFYKPQLRLKNTEEGILIEIAKDVPGSDYRIQIIRSLNGGKYRTLNTISDSFEYLDKANNTKKEDVKYRAKILYKDGTRSKYGNEVVLEK